MKKVLIVIMVIAAGISSCKKEDKSVFDKSPDERLTEKLAEYQAQLISAQSGWKGFLTTDSGKGATYSFYFKFNNENRVTMLSDFDSLSAVTLKESSYRIKALQQPSLIFDTYSYLHVLADPDETVAGGIRGAGLLSDFEFYFDTVSADTVHLVGRFHGSKMVLIRATQAESDAYGNGQLASGLFINKILTYFKRLTIGTQLFDVKIDPISRTFIFSALDAGGNLQTFSTGYYFTASGIVFTTPLVNGTETISGLDNIAWNATSQTINITVNGTAATIKGVIIPLKVDLTAPRRWRQYAVDNSNGFWISLNGFHVNGRDDAFGIKSLVSNSLPYLFLVYWPVPNLLSATDNDFFGPIFSDAAGTNPTVVYGTAPDIPTFTSDGRAIFIELGNYDPYPATGPAALSRDQLYITSGYYFVQTSATSYDMVSAADGKAWITWEF